MKFFASSLVVVALASLTNAYTLCGTPSSHILTVTGFDYNPKPPVPGNPITFDVAGTLSESVPGGTIKATVLAGALPLWQKTYDICAEAVIIGKQCPLPAGPYSFSKVETVPTILPPGTYTFRATSTTSAGKTITCIQDTFTIA